MKTAVRCLICPKGCILKPEETGDCRVRVNIDGKIRCTTYEQPCAISLDPIEKKPLYHFLPGTPVLSIGTPGCNLHCKQCQNWQISQIGIEYGRKASLRPEDLIQMAASDRCPAIAYTYTEPLVSYEYTYDCCKTARDSGLRNVLVTAAYINPDPLRKLCRYVDAANVDLKSFSDDFYREICDARLQPVLTALKLMKACGVMLEITNLLIPGLNDSRDETTALCDWIVDHLGDETPVHFSRFFPRNQRKHLPRTPTDTILSARQIALNAGLKHVYVGNMEDGEGENTRCSNCQRILIERQGYHVLRNEIENGLCPGCRTPVHGIWQAARAGPV